MLKKRVIFTLLYSDGYFMLSRNFRLQRVGRQNWLQANYNFSKIAFWIDELLVLDVTRGGRNSEQFCDELKAITAGCFVPIAAGGGVRTIEHARQLLRSGADKVVINTALFEARPLVYELARQFGQQCLVASLDVKARTGDTHAVLVDNGTRFVGALPAALQELLTLPVGELYLNSIDRDGTGQGYDTDILDQLPPGIGIPIILAGGAGNHHHLENGLADERVDAVATAHLFNFVGDGLKVARRHLTDRGFELARWFDPADFQTTQRDLERTPS